MQTTYLMIFIKKTEQILNNQLKNVVAFNILLFGVIKACNLRSSFFLSC